MAVLSCKSLILGSSRKNDFPFDRGKLGSLYVALKLRFTFYHIIDQIDEFITFIISSFYLDID